MIATAEFERDATEMQSDFPVAFTLRGIPCFGSKDSSEIGLGMLDSGYTARNRTRLVCILDGLFGMTPVTNDVITMDGKNWSVDGSPEFSPDGVNVNLTLVQIS